jgi:hypothetical protein
MSFIRASRIAHLVLFNFIMQIIKIYLVKSNLNIFKHFIM